MTPERWHQIEHLFDEALDLDSAACEALLDAACAGDPELRREVEALLAADAAAPAFLDQDAAAFAGPVFDHEGMGKTGPAAPGQHLGAYRLVREIGHGGMSVVYLAERADGHFRQQAAIKLLRHLSGSHELRRRRFRTEQQILASLHHPHIARVYDGGVTGGGWPYLVMEYVEGLPLTGYCDAHRLGIDARLQLFEQVCAAVQHAHQRLIVHRDLKPSNIMVMEEGQVKLLDFGIAKLLDPDAAEGIETMALTGTGMRLLTPEYAAPEQVRGEAITTATDVYALGVLLYELLTGRRPYDLAGKSPGEIEHIICNEEPTKPSTLVTRAEDEATRAALSQARALLGGQLAHRLRGDLDVIVMKALRKEPEARYASAQDVANDVRRYREGLPVEAREATVGYRVRKFVRRHRQHVLVTAAFVVLLAAVIGFYTAQLRAQRDAARLEAQTAERVSAFTTGLFTAADPWEEVRMDTLRARDLLDRGAAKIDEELTAEPEVRAAMMQVMGTVYHRLGLYDQAQTFIEQALATRRSLHGDVHPDVAESLFGQAIVRYRKGDYATSESRFRQAISIWEGLGEDHRHDLAAGYNNLAAALDAQGQYQQADSLYRRALHVFETQLGVDHPQVAVVLRDWGLMKSVSGDYQDADSMLHRAYEIRRDTLGDTHPSTAQSLGDLASLAFTRADYDQAERFAEAALAAHRSYLGNTHPSTAGALNRLGVIQRARGNLAVAEQLHRKALAIYRVVHTEPHPVIATTMNYVGLALRKQEKLEEAEAMYRDALAIGRDLWGEVHPNMAMITYNIGGILQAQSRYQESERLYRQVLAIDRSWYGNDHYEVGVDLIKLASVLYEKGDYADAEVAYLEGLDILRNRLGDDHPRLAEGQAGLGALLVATGRHTEAERLLLNALRIRTAAFGTDDPQTTETRRALADLYDAWGKPEQAAEYHALITQQP